MPGVTRYNLMKKIKSNFKEGAKQIFKVGYCSKCKKELLNYMSFVTICTKEIQKFNLVCYDCYSKS